MLQWGQKGNGNRCQIPTPTLLKTKNLSLLMLKTLWKENFIKCRWLICHTLFTLVTLIRNLAVNIGFIIKPFSKDAAENHSRKKNRILTFSFSVVFIVHNIDCFERKGFSKDASSWVFKNLSKKIFDLKASFSGPSSKDQYYFYDNVFCTAIFKGHFWSLLLSLFLLLYDGWKMSNYGEVQTTGIVIFGDFSFSESLL